MTHLMNKMGVAVAALAVFAIGDLASVAPAAEARENRPLKCTTSRARAAPSLGGPALIANVPRSMATQISVSIRKPTDCATPGAFLAGVCHS